ncbi:MAG: hypothetical protein KBB11_03825 [Bacteroidales bacterium]|nr:hypothetical protein [Bacteroidales bacterium]HOY39776.1 hypothetical protein [Bacteroidales bacterium]HQP03862.1 hypothetical protein [Bacteroidales bacterium]
MKKLILTLFVLASLPFLIFAHPPKKVKLNYTPGELVIEVIHPVKDAAQHYIDQITILIDGKEYKILKYSSQTTNESLIIEVKVPDLQKGSVIQVKANCNKMGLKSGKLKVK